MAYENDVNSVHCTYVLHVITFRGRRGVQDQEEFRLEEAHEAQGKGQEGAQQLKESINQLSNRSINAATEVNISVNI